MLVPGTLIGGRYRLVRLLGEGGMGVVWAATNVAIGRDVAIKVMLPDVAADPTALQRFFTEARICGTIRHPGIVDVLDLGNADDGSPFLVMELLEGESLEGILRRAATLKPLEILPVIRDVARTLALAHRNGVIHRDVKPGNVFLHRLSTGQPVAKVLDFGISKVLGGGRSVTMTHTGTVVGSPAYMSPEQAAAQVEIDARSDVYSLGVVLYESLSGRLPFLSDNYNALIIDIAVRTPPSIADLVPGLPRPVVDLMQAVMAHDREQRVPSAAALADRIESVLSALGASPRLAVPDPASIAGSPASLRGARVGAQTSSALASNAGRPRRGSPWIGVLVAVSALLVGVVAIGATMLRGGTAPIAAASAPIAPESAPVATAAPTATATAQSAPEPTASSAAPEPSASSSAATIPAKRPLGPGKLKKKGTGVWGYD